MKAPKDFSTATTVIAEKVAVKSAINPLLWLSAVVTPSSLVVSAFMVEVPIWLSLLIVMPPGSAIFCYIYFMIKDPDRLQSEKFQTDKMQMLYMQQQSNQNRPNLADHTKVVPPSAVTYEGDQS